jgi:hypothetical protein
LLPEDEAFVLGFTLGATRKFRPFQVELFKWCASRLYPGAFRFDFHDAQVFEHGVRTGRASGAADLSRVDFRAVLHMPLGELRRELGVRAERLARLQLPQRRREVEKSSGRNDAFTSVARLAVFPGNIVKC